MALTVRSPDGEVQVASLPELERAVRTGLVNAEDEVQLEPGQPWKKVREVVTLRRWRDRVNGWYVLAAILLVELVVGAGYLIVLVTVSTYVIWLESVRPHKRRRPMRWW